MRELIDRYQWVQQLDVVMTFAVIQGRSVDEVVRIYGGDPAQSQLMTTIEAEDAGLDDGDDFYFQVFEHQDAVVALESNGWSGTVPEVARRASADDGHFFSVHWNANGMFRITEARGGKVTAYFEPTFGVEPAAPEDVMPEWAEGLELQPAELRAACLALVEQETGVAFEEEWLVKKLPTFRIPDPDELLRDVEGARTP
ncbi:DUF6461 domain-containing protein [Lentzea aerocolonigenes]|uniref:DUF6461 domain-containing protein n=1 Tax=Lentzea aerocolonigenes TaxID=68170 RepID=UPI0004C3C1B4|nr:DUF6461 domain-containing protein [Lentzea aerocolonigenes]MCP2245725.1 hypothetical protein [Lentzea aerocolonigenes]